MPECINMISSCVQKVLSIVEVHISVVWVVYLQLWWFVSAWDPS